jgi:hypothetical protein
MLTSLVSSAPSSLLATSALLASLASVASNASLGLLVLSVSLASSTHWPCKIIGSEASLALLVSFPSTSWDFLPHQPQRPCQVFWLISLVCLISLSINHLFCHHLLPTAINAVITIISQWPKQEAATLELGVAASANKVANAVALYFFAPSSLQVSLM